MTMDATSVAFTARDILNRNPNAVWPRFERRLDVLLSTNRKLPKKNSYPAAILPVKGKSVNLFGLKPFERFPIFLGF